MGGPSRTFPWDWTNSFDGDVSLNADLSIGDPANLEECVAVGSVHKTRPQSFGISHFSSKGPTGAHRLRQEQS
ncbi:MAG: hypothetical protein O7A71_06475 [Chloroflexi bacterium]|nr:hypothetical protein [Chloroflexota bacterium]